MNGRNMNTLNKEVKKVKIGVDKVIVKHVTCPYCKKWINNMSSITCKHLKQWDGNHAYFEDTEKTNE